jgi:fatty-acyl-CoA synthase
MDRVPDRTPALDLRLRLQPDTARYTLPRFLQDVTERHAGLPALFFDGQIVSYEQLQEAARRLACALVASGVVKGARVGLLMANRPDWVVSAFAVSMTGAVIVPVNTFATPEERDYILRHADVSVLLMQPALLKREFVAELLASHPGLEQAEPGRICIVALPQLRRIVCFGAHSLCGGIESGETFLGRSAQIDEELLDAIGQEVTPADDAVLIYTSGTTARPKGILHMQRAPVIQSWRFAELMGLEADDRVLTAQPLFWSAGMAMSLGATLAAGATLILQETFDAGAALELVERERATALHAWPHQEKSMAEHPDARSRDLSSLRKIEFSSPLAPLAGLEADKWGTYGSYGLSETFTLASALPASAPAEQRAATSGRPLPGMEMRIADPVMGVPVCTDEPGEIALKGVTFMRAYYKVEPELYLDEYGFFRTQDGGRFDDDGLLHWTGRLSNLIKTGGANVSPLEIEEAAAGCTGIQASAALGVPHPTLGEAIVLCAVVAPGATLDRDMLAAHLRTKLAAYKQPRVILKFDAAEVSFTGNQKLQIEPLRDAAYERLAIEHVEIAGYRYGA